MYYILGSKKKMPLEKKNIYIYCHFVYDLCDITVVIMVQNHL